VSLVKLPLLHSRTYIGGTWWSNESSQWNHWWDYETSCVELTFPIVVCSTRLLSETTQSRILKLSVEVILLLANYEES